MPRRTDKALITEQLAEAKRLHAEAEQARAVIELNDKTELEKAWQCGKRLNLLKEQLPHGEWESWIGSQWPELAKTTRTIYMRIDRENPNVQRVEHLKHDSIRAYMIAKVPRKTHPKQESDEKLDKSNDYTSTANELNRQAERAKSGLLVIKDDGEFCDDFEQGFAWLYSVFARAGRLPTAR